MRTFLKKVYKIIKKKFGRNVKSSYLCISQLKKTVMKSLEKEFQEIRPSYVKLTKKETYEDFKTEELRSLFLEELQKHFSRWGSNSDLSFPIELNMDRNELIDASITYHQMLLNAIDEQLRIDEKWFPTSK